MTTSYDPSNEIEELLLTIERLRRQLEESVALRGAFTDPAVLRVSAELDRVLNEYQNLLRQRLGGAKGEET